LYTVTIFLIDRHDLRRRESVNRGENRRSDQPAKTQGHEVAVAVNKVEFGGLLKRRREVKILGNFGISIGILLVPLSRDGMKASAGDRIGRGEECHVPTARHQTFSNIAGDRFPSTIALRGCAPSNR